MASITIKLGSLTSTFTTTDNAATKVLSNYADAYGLAEGGTPQERLDATLQHLVLKHISDVSEGHQRRVKRQAADAEVEAAPERMEVAG